VALLEGGGTAATLDDPEALDAALRRWEHQPFNRIRKIERIIHPAKLTRATVRALVTPGADRRAVLREVAQELPLEFAIRRENWFGGFRYAGWSPTERPGWSVGAPPVRRPVTDAAAETTA
jgi:hypothetical protein